MTQLDREGLDRHITGNYGEDSVPTYRHPTGHHGEVAIPGQPAYQLLYTVEDDVCVGTLDDYAKALEHAAYAGLTVCDLVRVVTAATSPARLDAPVVSAPERPRVELLARDTSEDIDTYLVTLETAYVTAVAVYTIDTRA